ncbi:MAG TPA: hypothetical protein VFE46_14915 [Pirellulales bacterium]|jgi:hypothetical protein|nr:hypothetical protein [Pirellulales bacterium]
MKTAWPDCVAAVAIVTVLSGAWVAKNLRADDAPQPLRVQSATPANAVKPSSATSSIPIISPGEIAATPEMWFYEQAMRRYDDPKNGVRAAAEFEANQRRARIAAMQWYGYSNLRPASGIDPFAGPLQPTWIGNGYNRFTWIAPAHPAAVWAIPGVSGGY